MRGEDAAVTLDGALGLHDDGRVVERNGRPRRKVHGAVAAARPGGGAQGKAAAARNQPRHQARRRLLVVELRGELDVFWW